MKKLLFFGLFSVSLIGMEAAGSIAIDSTNGGDGQDTINLNVKIDASTGAGSTGSPWFDITGSVTESGAFGGVVGITFDAMKNVSTNSATRGDELTNGVFNRDGDGFMGVDGAPSGGGLSNGTDREGISFAIDEITDIDPSLSVQITGIDVQNVGRVGTDPDNESFFIVNLATRDYIEFIPVGEGLTAGTFDVSSLNLVATVGSLEPIAALYSGDQGGLRVNGLTIDVIPESATIGLLGMAGVGILAIRRLYM